MEPTARSTRSRLTWLDSTVLADLTQGPPHLSQKEDSAVRCGPLRMHSPSQPFRLAMNSVLHWSVGVVKRCETDPMPCSNCLHLVDALLSDGPSSLREGFEPP